MRMRRINLYQIWLKGFRFMAADTPPSFEGVDELLQPAS